MQSKHSPFLPTDLPRTTFWRLGWDLWIESFIVEGGAQRFFTGEMALYGERQTAPGWVKSK